jgi:hypothetical protein
MIREEILNHLTRGAAMVIVGRENMFLSAPPVFLMICLTHSQQKSRKLWILLLLLVGITLYLHHLLLLELLKLPALLKNLFPLQDVHKDVIVALTWTSL